MRRNELFTLIKQQSETNNCNSGHRSFRKKQKGPQQLFHIHYGQHRKRNRKRKKDIPRAFNNLLLVDELWFKQLCNYAYNAMQWVFYRKMLWLKTIFMLLYSVHFVTFNTYYIDRCIYLLMYTKYVSSKSSTNFQLEKLELRCLSFFQLKFGWRLWRQIKLLVSGNVVLFILTTRRNKYQCSIYKYRALYSL